MDHVLRKSTLQFRLPQRERTYLPEADMRDRVWGAPADVPVNPTRRRTQRRAKLNGIDDFVVRPPLSAGRVTLLDLIPPRATRSSLRRAQFGIRKMRCLAVRSVPFDMSKIYPECRRLSPSDRQYPPMFPSGRARRGPRGRRWRWRG